MVSYISPVSQVLVLHRLNDQNEDDQAPLCMPPTLPSFWCHIFLYDDILETPLALNIVYFKGTCNLLISQRAVDIYLFFFKVFVVPSVFLLTGILERKYTALPHLLPHPVPEDIFSPPSSPASFSLSLNFLFFLPSSMRSKSQPMKFTYGSRPQSLHTCYLANLCSSNFLLFLFTQSCPHSFSPHTGFHLQ